MIIVQLNVMHATETSLLCGARLRGRGWQQGKIRERKKGRKKERKGNEHLDTSWDHLWHNKLGLALTHTCMHRESSSPWFLRSEVRYKMTQWCYSVAHLILNLLSSLSTLFGLWPLLQLAKWKATVGDRFSVCLLNQGEWKILCCVKDSLV